MSTRHRPWDLLVVGGGTAGLVGATTAASLGARVALVERDRTGGDCLWTGCVPSKALVAAAGRAADARRAAALGVHVRDVRVDLAGVMAHVRSTIDAIQPHDSVETLEAAGVRVLHGTAALTGPTTATVDGVRHRFRRALLATGASPAVPDLPGMAAAGALTSETVWDLTALPARLVVLGAGSIGCELAQAFARLGSGVTLVDAAPRVLVHEDPDAAAVVRDALVADGVRVLTQHEAVAVHPGVDGAGELEVVGPDGRAERVPYAALLLATGRRPRTAALGLASAGVAVDAHGFVIVDRHLTTTNPRVWAAGDVTPLPQYTHLAGMHASTAASNAVLGLRRSVDLSSAPRVTFTDPEVAAVGAPTWSGPGGRAPRTVTHQHADLDRALADGRPDGFARLALSRRGTVLGATVVGPRAGETLAEVTLAVRHGLTTTDLAASTHPYPTYGDGVWNAAVDVLRAGLRRGPVRLGTRALVAVRRALTRDGDRRG